MKSSPPKVDANCSSAFPIVALGVLAVLSGVFHTNLIAVAFGVPLLLGPIALYLFVRISIAKVTVERELPEAVFEGEVVEVTIRLHNRSALPIFYPQIVDVFTPELHARKAMHFPFRVTGWETVTLGYDGKCLLPRGIYPLDSCVLSVSDPFGWIQVTRPLEIRHSLKVYPTIKNFGLTEKLGAVVSALRDEFKCARRGESLEFFSVREYQRGDPLRKIHWGLTAHRGYPVVRQFTQDSVGDVHLFLDACRSSLIGIGRGSSLEHSVRIVVALANHARRHGFRVGLYSCSKGVEHALRPASDEIQIQRVLEIAAVARPDGTVPLPDLLARYEPNIGWGDCVMFTVSPYLYDSDDLYEVLGRLRRRGMRGVAVVFDGFSFRSLWHDELPRAGAQQQCIERLKGMGVEIFEVTCGADLEVVFRGDPR